MHTGLVIFFIIAVTAAAVFGALFARKNTTHVNDAIAEAEKLAKAARGKINQKGEVDTFALTTIGAGAIFAVLVFGITWSLQCLPIVCFVLALIGGFVGWMGTRRLILGMMGT